MGTLEFEHEMVKVLTMEGETVLAEVAAVGRIPGLAPCVGQRRKPRQTQRPVGRPLSGLEECSLLRELVVSVRAREAFRRSGVLALRSAY
jgi:hypothetical protein